MKIIKEGKIKRTRYLLLERESLSKIYKVIKHASNCTVTELFRSTSLVSASRYFDNLFGETR